jgi:hypothetical protein
MIKKAVQEINLNRFFVKLQVYLIPDFQISSN